MLSPHVIYIESDIRHCAVTRQVLERFPQVERQYIKRMSTVVKSLKYLDHSSYVRNRLLFLARKRGAVIKRCPCSRLTVGCRYFLFDVGFGCPHECTYCFLNFYANTPGMIIHANQREIFSRARAVFERYPKKIFRIGTSELTDPLALEEIVPTLGGWIRFFSRFDNVLFEIKTKRANIESLLTLPGKRYNTVVSWSVNTPEVIAREETGAASLPRRLQSARACREAGYAVSFHFDPIVADGDWRSSYEKVVRSIARTVGEHNVAWISLGTFRFDRGKRALLYDRFPHSRLLYGELMRGYDGKLRYFRPLRVEVYRCFISMIQQYLPGTFVYLCMESPAVWQEVYGEAEFSRIIKGGFEPIFYQAVHKKKRTGKRKTKGQTVKTKTKDQKENIDNEKVHL